VTASESQLLQSARDGDPRALEELLESHEARVYRFALRLCRHPQDAEDVLQESLLAAARGLARFRGDASLGTWLYAIARSYCIKKRRRGRSAVAELSLEEEAAHAVLARADPAPGPDVALESRRLESALEGAIARLDRPYREVLVLRDVEGLTAAEVAKVTGLSIPAIKSRLHRARARIREDLAPLLLGREDQGRPAGPGPCPNVVRLLSRYLEDDISSRTCARMERHLSSCPRCRTSCDSLREVLRLCRTHPSPRVPPALEARVRQALRRLVESAPSTA
jgi:RNA polymerase sigma-70 factor (ECF subfamily)